MPDFIFHSRYITHSKTTHYTHSVVIHLNLALFPFLLTLANSASNRTSSAHTSIEGLEAGPDLWLCISTSLLYSSESNTGSKAAKR